MIQKMMIDGRPLYIATGRLVAVYNAAENETIAISSWSGALRFPLSLSNWKLEKTWIRLSFPNGEPIFINCLFIQSWGWSYDMKEITCQEKPLKYDSSVPVHERWSEDRNRKTSGILCFQGTYFDVKESPIEIREQIGCCTNERINGEDEENYATG